MMWNTGMAWGPWMWLVMGGGTVAFWAAVVLAVRWAFGGQSGRLASGREGRVVESARTPLPAEGPSRTPGPLEVLQDRLARGEIDVDEYTRTRTALIESDPMLGRDRTDAAPR
ncbi:hypothetical protein [Terrabacter tumescens]|nr:hypothetical protein [Terrabacter tumescens]